MARGKNDRGWGAKKNFSVALRSIGYERDPRLKESEAVNTSLVPMIDAGTLLTAYGRSVFPSFKLTGL